MEARDGPTKKYGVTPLTKSHLTLSDNFTKNQASVTSDTTIKQAYERKFNTRYLISPNQPKMVAWDFTIGIALIYTGLFTPWEIAFLGDFCFPEFLFLFNRCIDILFVTDMCLQFFLIKDIERPTGVETVRDPKKLAKMYLTGWFPIDFVSILPFDILGCYIGALPQLQKLRFIRLVR
jgi:potassium voltage-gated channel Eag-related subfamily H protein 7